MTQPQNPLESLVADIAERLAERIEKRLLANPPIKPRLLSVEQAAQYLGRTPSAVKNMLATGKLKCVHIDKRLYFDVQDLDRMIEEAKGE